MEETRQIQPTATENNNSDDLDLIELIRICWRACVKYICRPINFCIRFTLKHWWQTAIIIVVAFVLSVSYNMWINPKYEMSIKFANKYLSSQYFIDATNSLFQSDNREYLASKLGISADSIDYLKKSQALYSLYGDSNHSFSYKDKDNKFGTGEGNDSEVAEYGANINEFYVDIVVARDKHLLDGIDSAIIDYLSKSSYLSTRISDQTRILQTQINEYATESQKLDSVRDILYFSPTTILSGGNEISTTNKQLLTDEIINVNTTLQELKNKISDYKPVEIVNPPIVKLQYNIVSDGIRHTVLLTLLGLVIMLCITYRKNIKDYINS